MGKAEPHSAQAVDASDLIDEANNERTRVSAIQTEISGVESDLRNLEQQENGLQISVRNLKSQVKSQESNQRQYQSKLREAKGAQGEISVLEVRASTLANDINSKRRNVRNVKEYLENCSTMLKEKSVEVNSQSTAIEWLHGRTYRRKQAFNRQKALMAKVTDELAKIQVELPMLLYDEGLNLLGYEPGETAQHAVIEIGPSIPDLCCYAKDPVMAIPGGWGDDE